MPRLIMQGVEVMAPALGDSLERLTTFQAAFEKLFLSLAQRLPALSTGIEALSAKLASVAGSERGIRARVEARMEAMVQRQRDATRLVLDETQTGVHAAARVGTLATTLAKRLGEVQRTSHDLRLAGLNASFTAQGLGSSGAAFQAVNGALIDVADSSARLAETIQRTTHSMSDLSGRLGDAQQSLAREITHRTDATETDGRTALDGSTTMLATLVQQLAQVTLQGHEVTSATARIMLAIQQQDILRQGIDHVLLVLRALNTQYGSAARSNEPEAIMGYLRFQQDAGRLSAQLMGSLRLQLEHLLGMVLHPLEDLATAAALINEKIGDPAQTEEYLARPADRLVDGLSSLPPLGASLENCVIELTQVSAQVTSLKPRLVQLEQVPTNLKLVAVLMKIETARCEALVRAQTIADDLGTAGKAFRDLHGEASDAMLDFSTALKQVRTALDRQRASWDELRGTPSLLADAAAGMHDLAKTFRGQLEDLAGTAQALDERAAELHARLTDFGAVIAATDAVRDACEACRDDAARLSAEFVALGCVPAETPQALAALIAQFTIFEHQQLATGAADLATPNTDPGGELTFF